MQVAVVKYNAGTGYGFNQGVYLSYYYLRCAVPFGVTCCRTYRQYISDCHIHSGADAYLCAQDIKCFCGNNALRRLDNKQYYHLYDGFVQ